MARKKVAAPVSEANAEVKSTAEVITEVAAVIDPVLAQVHEIVKAGFAAGKSHDDIKGEIFVQAKVPFGKINSVFVKAAVGLGLMVDPKTMSDSIDKIIGECVWDGLTSWSQVEMNIDDIVTEVPGATRGKALNQIVAYCKKNEIALPERVKEVKVKGTRSKGGKLAEALVKCFADVEAPTRRDLYDAILPTVKGPENALYYVAQYFGILTAVKSGKALAIVEAETKSQNDSLPKVVSKKATAAAPVTEPEAEVEVEDETTDSEE